jgi:adenylate cyclase
LSLDPTIPQARLPIIKRLQQRGKHEQAAAEMEEAIRLGEDSWEVNKEAGRFYLNKRDFVSAAKHYERAVELMEGDFHAWAMLSTCYQALGNTPMLRESAKRMISESQVAVQQDPSNGAALGILAGGYALLGEKERAREWIGRALLVDPDNLNMRHNFACVLAISGDKDEALKMLESALSVCGPYQVSMTEADTDLDSVRDDPRYDALIAAAKKRLRMI